MRKPNYRFERAERNRVKQAKKEEKARRRDERKAETDQPVSGKAQDDAEAS